MFRSSTVQQATTPDFADPLNLSIQTRTEYHSLWPWLIGECQDSLYVTKDC
jgi:hypothetical protein